jgi:hypothetical protein
MKSLSMNREPAIEKRACYHTTEVIEQDSLKWLDMIFLNNLKTKREVGCKHDASEEVKHFRRLGFCNIE